MFRQITDLLGGPTDDTFEGYRCRKDRGIIVGVVMHHKDGGVLRKRLLVGKKYLKFKNDRAQNKSHASLIFQYLCLNALVHDFTVKSGNSKNVLDHCTQKMVLCFFYNLPHTMASSNAKPHILLLIRFQPLLNHYPLHLATEWQPLAGEMATWVQWQGHLGCTRTAVIGLLGSTRLKWNSLDIPTAARLKKAPWEGLRFQRLPKI